MDFEQRFQATLERVVERDRGYQKKAFYRTKEGKWRIHKHIFSQGFSSSEAITIGPLVVLYREMYGLEEVDVPEGTDGDPVKVHIWSGSVAVATFFLRLDDRQLRAFQPMVE